MTIARLVTHNGPFHADDALSHHVLSTLFPDAMLVRTRDEAEIHRHPETSIVFDVGGHYDAGTGNFDHHQPGRPERPCGLPYSAFGLVWRHYGHAYLDRILDLDIEAVDAIHARIDTEFVREIDAGDNGVPGHDALLHPLTFANLVEEMRPDFDTDPERMTEALYVAFKEASRFAGGVLDAKIRTAAATSRAARLVEHAIATRTDPRWIELPVGAPFLEQVLEPGLEDILYALVPGHGEWAIKAVNVDGTSFDVRHPLPANWAGLRGADLARESGVPDAVFCHRGLFVATAKSRDGARALLERALEA